MQALDRKLLRDLWHMRGQALAICLVMASGVATYVMSLSTLESLQRAQSTYYDRYRFAQVFAQLKRAPQAMAVRLAEIPGVAQVQTRIVADVILNVPDMTEPATGRLLSLTPGAAVQLNDLHLRAGRWPERGRANEALVSEGFAAAHRLRPGDQLKAIINGRLQPLHIVGIALSPEFIYAVRPGELLPDARRFGIFWMDQEQLAAAFDMKGAFNNVALSLMPGASIPEVLRQVDQLTERYGGISAHDRTDQVSHKFLANEMTQLRGMGVIAPLIFLAVSAFLMQVAFSRQIGLQREQIALLRAFGYSAREVGLHYLKMIGLLVLLGCILGTLMGVWFGRSITELYTQFFSFPVFDYYLSARVVLQACGLSAMAALLGTVRAIRNAMTLPPAEAMRPEPPARFRATILERLGLSHWLNQPARMILRQLERQPLKAALSVLGIGLAVAVLVLGNCAEDSIHHVLHVQFGLAQRYDLMVNFVEPTSGSVAAELRAWPGVRTLEELRAVPARVSFGHRSRRLALMGLEPEGELFRLIDDRLQLVPIPEEGLLISAKLAEVLHCNIGDWLEVEIQEGERPHRRLQVTGLVNDFTDPSAYMSTTTVRRLLREGPTCTGAFLTIDPAYEDAIYHRLKRSPRVAGVSIKEATLRTFKETIAENLLRMKMFNVIFACIIAVGVIYNCARISLSERSRELATLRVLGFTRTEISVILLGELGILTLLALPVGLVLGYGFSAWMMTSLDTETQRFPLVVNSSTYGFAVVVTLLATLVSGLFVRRRLDHLDLVAVLKARE